LDGPTSTAGSSPRRDRMRCSFRINWAASQTTPTAGHSVKPTGVLHAALFSLLVRMWPMRMRSNKPMQRTRLRRAPDRPQRSSNGDPHVREKIEWLVSGCCPRIQSALFRTASGAGAFSGRTMSTCASHIASSPGSPFSGWSNPLNSWRLILMKNTSRATSLGRTGDETLHVLVAVDVESDNVRVVTAYRPDASELQDDLRTRRPKK